jgi:RNA polymerase sigma factor (sigma-70 family)
MGTVQNAPKPYTERELTELLRQAQEGSPEALDEFFSRLRERILALAKQAAWNIGLRLADAEDAAQETMLVVHEHLHEFQRWENVMRFARKTLRNKLGNYHQYRRYRDPLEIPLEKARALGRMDVVLEEIELQRILERALEELHRIRPHDALILRGVCNGLSKKELCQMLGLTSHHFDVKLHRCRQLLRRILREWGVIV